MNLGKYNIVLILTLILMSACSQSDERRLNGLRVGIEDSPKTLDPRYATDAYGSRITHHLIFSCLVQHGYDLKVVPDLAERFETPDNRTYVFYLRKGVTFHDGTPVTAEDVKFTFEHLMNPATQSPFSSNYRDKIKGITVVDPHTVRFALTQPTASFLNAIMMPILPRHIVFENDDFPKRLLGSGPFRFVSQSATEIVLEAFDDYFEGAPKLDRIIFKVVSDDNTRFLKMKKGELDLVINAISADKIGEFKAPPLSDMYLLMEEPGISYKYLAFNLEDSKVKDPRIRQAIAYGINVDEIIRYRLHGHAERATGLLSPINWYYEGDVAAYPYDTDKARALLDAAGLRDPDGDGPEPRLHLVLKTSNNAQVLGIARIIQAQLAEIGIRFDVRSYEWGTFYGDVKSGNFQVTSMRWVGVTEPDFFYDIFHSSQMPPKGRNRGRYADDQIDRLVEEGRFTIDPERRKSIYAQVQKKVAQDLPYVSLWHTNNVSIVHRRVKGYLQHPMAGFLSLKEVFLD